VGDPGSIPGLGRSPWRRKWQPTPVFLPGKFHGQRSLVGYKPWGCRVRHGLSHFTSFYFLKILCIYGCMKYWQQQSSTKRTGFNYSNKI